ncbi:Crp/Fnr family transcriptional regulator [Kinneretia aquatilis]|uniref:Crp/Fnr family transcriptional regulator n=1 Tax=Kinneretia aquatilis TaxID=2070761 RepID=UPI0014950EC3|nr:Crp/Fnr family transcriptional regulator [Paucibacter aquatile]WIV97269.1 Crp/Fnr family transcriptional regulator [Paucibacter aquatile]
MPAESLSPLNNQLLTGLPAPVREAMLAQMEGVALVAGTTLYVAGAELSHVYFPVTAVISLVSPLLDGACIEIAVVGQEGLAGVCAFMGGGQALSNAVVQRSGMAWRMKAADIAKLARDAEPVMQQLLRYTQVLFTHMAQSSACHQRHALAPQLCRWLLEHLDRQAGDEMRITQERISVMLGVRREGVTAAALQLQKEGLISYHRGQLRVLDRHRLKKQSCECYGVVELAYARLRSASSLEGCR